MSLSYAYYTLQSSIPPPLASNLSSRLNGLSSGGLSASSNGFDAPPTRNTAGSTLSGGGGGGGNSMNNVGGGGGGGEKDTFTEMVADFRQRLKTVMDEREEAFRKLESSISSTSKEIQVRSSLSLSLSLSLSVCVCLSIYLS